MKVAKIIRLTSSGARIIWFGLSYDGRLLVYASNERDRARYEMYVREMETGSVVHIPVESKMLVDAAFSPDSRSLAYTSVHPNAIVAERPAKPSLYVMPALGGPAQKLAEDVYLLKYSPDGRWIVFSRPNPNRLFLMPAAGGPRAN